MITYKTLLGFFSFKEISRINFRNDINLLRAISVLSVVFYHVEFKYFQGGWLGVDVFFVISGFLISNIIVYEISLGNFSFRNFYIKRVKRILPALFATLTISLPFAYELLSPNSLIKYSDSVISSILFYSNYYLQNLDFYTSLPAKFIPNLHIWSLSIEEQFYFIFPVSIFLIYKIFKEKFVFFYILLFLTSILFNMTTQEIFKFYQIQFRVWEFLAGMFAMLIYQKLKIQNVSLIGILFILFSFMFFDDSWINDLEPKLIAVVGTVLILISRDSLLFGYKLKSLSFIGTSSYSLYLLHQPVFSFLRIYLNRVNIELSFFIKVITILIVIFCSFMMYKFVEKPFINKSLKYCIKFLLICFLFISSFSYIVHKTNGMEFRYDVPKKLFTLNEITSIELFQDNINCNNRNINEICIFENKSTTNIYVVGDSLLKNLYGIAEASVEYNFNYYHYTSNNCLFIFNYKFNDANCPYSDKDELDQFFLGVKNSIIIYGGRYPFHIEKSGFDNSYVKEAKSYGSNNDINPVEILNTLEKFLENNIVLIVYPIPEHAWVVSDLFLDKKLKWTDNVSYPIEAWEQRKKSSYQLLNNIEHKNLIRIFPDEIFCDSFISGECVSKFENNLYFFDEIHLTLEGQKLVSNLIINKLVELNIIKN